MDKKAVEIAKDFMGRVGKDFRISRGILFGSRARDDYLLDSDIDLLIVSEDFKGIFFTERMSRMYDFWDYGIPLETLCYTPEEFEKKRMQIGTVREAVKEGIEII
ncbi:MAG: hypothetical protein MSIBF_02990 [Candidatus Altiarchaeales archaeon IMC4]|nr:MAG: hypothetical protein MSIBF_02990 [Candidatus Altiarchaeales archaeon IMC4]